MNLSILIGSERAVEITIRFNKVSLFKILEFPQLVQNLESRERLQKVIKYLDLWTNDDCVLNAIEAL